MKGSLLSLSVLVTFELEKEGAGGLEGWKQSRGPKKKKKEKIKDPDLFQLVEEQSFQTIVSHL